MRSFRFQRFRRLRLQRDFARVLRRRCVVSDGPLVLYADRAPTDHARLGLRVGKAVGPAVVRNREKRRLREAFRLAQHDLPALDLVCVLKRPGESVAWYQKTLVRLAREAEKKLTRRGREARRGQSAE
jgi:ribonuclease P protein component